MSNVQATLLCNGFTVLTLPVDGEAIHVSVSRDTKVNRSACCQTLLIRPLANIELKTRRSIHSTSSYGPVLLCKRLVHLRNPGVHDLCLHIDKARWQLLPLKSDYQRTSKLTGQSNHPCTAFSRRRRPHCSRSTPYQIRKTRTRFERAPLPRWSLRGDLGFSQPCC